MNPTLAAALMAFGGALVGGIITYMIARREKSGRVATTDADRLWEQNDKLIKALTGDNTELRTRIHDLELQQRESERRERECDDRAGKQALQIIELQRALKIDTKG